MKTKPNFVFDTNTLISVLLSPNSTCKIALEKAERLGQIIFSDETINELSLVIALNKFDKYVLLSKRLEFVQRFEIKFKKIKITSTFTDCKDSNDDKFLHLAVDGSAACIITGDNHLLELHPFKNIAILSASNFAANF